MEHFFLLNSSIKKILEGIYLNGVLEVDVYRTECKEVLTHSKTILSKLLTTRSVFSPNELFDESFKLEKYENIKKKTRIQFYDFIIRLCD